jgi:hypothetical protein
MIMNASAPHSLIRLSISNVSELRSTQQRIADIMRTRFKQESQVWQRRCPVRPHNPKLLSTI